MAPVPQSSALTKPQLSLKVDTVDDLTRLARVFQASGLFNRAGNPDSQLAQCAVSLMAGMEAGFTPFASITGVYVVNGRPGFSAQLLAQAIKRHPDYDYRVIEKTDKACRIRFLCRGEELGVELFTMEMAERAGLTAERPNSRGISPWRAFPEAMLFARCLTAGMRTHCPDALGGHTPYTPEELGADGQIDEDGMVTVTVTAEPPKVASTLEELVTAAQLSCDARGLTPEGLVAFCQEVSKGKAKTLQELPKNILARLAKSGVSFDTVTRCNAVAAPEPEEEEPEEEYLEPVDDEGDLPVSWVA